LGILNGKKTTKKPNIKIYPWLSSKKRGEIMKKAKIIIFSGGHGTCFETIKYEKPSICIPTQPEQVGNAAKLQKLKCSFLVTNQNQLKQAIDKIDSDIKNYVKRIKKINNYSRKFNGVNQTVKIIESL
jgi:UDP:flavonoid glycosyltransferase YjiC (YdhE family)